MHHQTYHELVTDDTLWILEFFIFSKFRDFGVFFHDAFDVGSKINSYASRSDNIYFR